MRITNKEQLAAHGNREGRKIVAELLDAGLDALDPYVRVKQLVHVENGKIVLHTDGFEMKGDPHAGPLEFDLKDYDRVYVIGAAKGVQRAALAMEEALGDVLTGGHVIAKHGEDIICNKIGVTLAGHPVPDEACVEGCRKIEALARDITSRDLVFTITGSGCGSLMTYPADDITIDEIARFTHMMQIEKGVPTSDLNPIRTHIDRFKGGRLSRLFRPATLVHMTTADPSKQNTPVTRTTYFEMLEHNTFFPPLSTGTTYADCIAILQKWNAWDKTPASIQNRLLRGTPETENMSVEEYESLGARFFGLIFKDATVYPAVRKKAAEFGLPLRHALGISAGGGEGGGTGQRGDGPLRRAHGRAVPRAHRAPVLRRERGDGRRGERRRRAQSGILHGGGGDDRGQPEDRLRRGRHRRHGRPRRISGTPARRTASPVRSPTAKRRRPRSRPGSIWRTRCARTARRSRSGGSAAAWRRQQMSPRSICA